MSKSERLIGMVLGEAGVPCARLIARMLAQGGGDIPDTPAATSYLYGRVAAEGETPDEIIDGVGYVGAVLPNIDEVYTDELKESHPYALIHVVNAIKPYYWLQVFSEPVGYYVSITGNYVIRGNHDNSIEVHNRSACVINAGEVVENPAFGEDEIVTGGQVLTPDKTVWSNFDIASYSSDGSVIKTVAFAATEPIPIALSGVWVLNSKLTTNFDGFDNYLWVSDTNEVDITFSSNGAKYTGFAQTYYLGEKRSTLQYVNTDGKSDVYSNATGYYWEDEVYRTIDFGTVLQDVPVEFFTWFTANAVKQ